MKEYLDVLRARSLLTTVKEDLSPDLEAASVLIEREDRPILFEKVEGCSLRVAGNLYSTRDLLGVALGTSAECALSMIENAVKNPSNSRGTVVGFNGSDWDHNESADLAKLPILKYFEKDAGRYITGGIIAAKFHGSEAENLSFHRMLVLGRDKVAARIVPRHLNQILKESPDGRVRVSVILGPPPSVFIAASLQGQYGASEYAIANKISDGNLKLVTSELSEIAVPSVSEIVLEGWLDAKELAQEGPFVDLTATYDEIRSQPTIKFDRMHYRKDSVYQAVVGSSMEHSLFMGIPQELKIRDVLSKSIPRIRGVNLTSASNGYFHCVVSIEKGNDGDGKTAIVNCFAASHPLKLVIAVDSDVDPFDLAQVEWALATRFQADRGILMINGAKGSSLDPSSGKLALTSKLGLDATLPVNANREKFSRAKVMLSERASSIIRQIDIQTSRGTNIRKSSPHVES